MRRNDFPGSCQRCWQHVPAHDGVLERRGDRWTVSHEGGCPPYPGGYSGPTWVIDVGEPGTPDRTPGSPWTVGDVLRADVIAVEHPVPEDSPGRRGDAAGVSVSLIVSVLAVAEPLFIRDADGDSPAALIGEDGWWFRAKVRPATAEEAAPLLAEEAVAARRRDLEDRRLAEFAFGYGRVDDAEVPTEPDTSAAVAVPFGAEALRRCWPQNRLLVDQQAGVVWSLTYNGADGDDWSLNNAGSYVARRQPLTPRRAELIRALREEYELATWKSELRIEPAAARRLLDAGWDYRQAWILRCFALSDEADATAFLARSREDWDSAGWLDTNSSIYRHRVRPADAARLADAGVTYAAMCDLHEAGHTTIEQQIAATPPEVPDSPGRIILRPPANASRLTGIMVTSDPELARQWVSTRGTYWWSGAVEYSPGVRPVHVVRTGGLRRGWSLWDDGALVRGADWLQIYQPDRREPLSAPAPAGLPDAAAHAIGLVATCRNTTCRDRAIWHPLRDAVTHTETLVEQDQSDRVSWTSTKALYRHDYTLIDGSVRSLWRLHSSEGGMSSGGDGEFDERHELWPEETPARAAYSQHSLG